MRILVTWGSKRGGTEGIGRILGAALSERGHDVVALPVGEVRKVRGFDAVIVGGGLYANRWAGSARRFVNRHVRELRRVPVWFFSSGPLDDSADHRHIPATGEVSVLAERVGALGHETFGGRLTPDAKGFPAGAMARKKSGDWRNPARIRAWAQELDADLPHAVPGTHVDHPGRSAGRLVAYAAAGWAACAAMMLSLMGLLGETPALVIHARVAPLIFFFLARRYFHARGARDPLPTAIAWTAIVAALDLGVIAGIVEGSLDMFASVAGTWLPFTLIFLVIWSTGATLAMMPLPGQAPGQAHATA